MRRSIIIIKDVIVNFRGGDCTRAGGGMGEFSSKKGLWDVVVMILLYESILVVPYFMYASKIKHRNMQISWLMVYNLYIDQNRVFATDLE